MRPVLPSRAAKMKNHCRTTIAERMMETLAELPFFGDQVVCLSHDQAAPSGTRQSLEDEPEPKDTVP